ncbi:glycerophosphoryl diester phosphodiesterase [Paenibacillus shirakamiensis]|uniref:Glycerophosphoryl diester phosphodiesterase n=1 Tax=Paenibacillus shirakamiensis TaxID=1265935 RepID=A0ABS4JHX7_9BACL|nr:glycerophosphodiester phosphodiesterase family protein [Paenibacillus shirakamiensis]MBP2001320.1 glycerophosphoryl diester phosphodiesterase [Paenibacillus shirakamiensis]
MLNYCAAHRGFSGKAPENTMAAMNLAMENPYVRWVETDVQLSKDGVPFLIHDFTLNRTTNGRGPVKNASWNYLRTLDAGSWKSAAYAGERLVTLDEFLTAVRGRLKVNIELKTENNMYPGLEEKVIDCVKRQQMQDDVVLTSFDVNALAKVKSLDPSMEIGLIIDGYPPDLLDRLKQMDSAFLSISARHITPALANEAAERGVQMMAWTIDDPVTMRRIAQMHPDLLICTNRPDVWQATLIDGENQELGRWRTWFKK